MSLSAIDLTVVIIYAIGIFSLAQYVSREKAGHQKDTSDYFLASKNLPVVGDRRIADRGQYFGRADRRHVGLGLCHRPRHRVVRMDGGADPADRRQILPADLPQEPHLHDAAVPPAAVRQRAAGDHGGVLARALRVREPDLDHLARLDRGQQGRRHRPECRAGDPRRFRFALPDQGRPQGGRADRHRPGHVAGARRPRRRLSDADQDRRRRGPARRLRQADRGRARATST